MTDDRKIYDIDPVLVDVPMPIVTPRLIIRPATIADAHDVAIAKQEVWEQLQTWMSWANDGEETYEATLRVFEALADNDLSIMIARCRDTGKVVVSTGLASEEEGVFHTGYWVSKGFLGRGYATEATAAVMHYAHQVLHAKKFTICYYDGNDKSRNVMEKLGFEFSHTVKEGKARCADDQLVDVHHYDLSDMRRIPPLEISWGTEP